ncbi:MAG: hypothetical protein E7052_11590 [Lentisphaerae bacterium]|nr:hypothetical protein [Lentisphaerota bacterium]
MNFIKKILGAKFLLCRNRNSVPVNPDQEIFADRNNSADMLKGILPEEVRTIACIAPGSYPGGESYPRGIKLLEQAGYKVKVMPHAFERPAKGQTSTRLESRLKDFYAAWLDPEVDMILCIRGGTGCGELMSKIDWQNLPQRHELYFQGYSDVTMILCALLKRNYGHPVAGAMVSSLQGLIPDALAAMHNMHHNCQVGPVDVIPLVPGDCEGLPLAGLLARLSVVVKTSDRPAVKDRIIFIESVSATLPEIRQQFKILLDEKFFDGARGVVFCCFTKTGAGENDIEELLQELAGQIGLPVYMRFPFGHQNISYTIDFQRKAVIKNNTVIFPVP